MYCRYCGSKVDENVKFCPYCGREIVTDNVRTEVVDGPATTNKDSSADNFALIGFILALASFITGITCIPGLVLSILGRKSVKNKGMAIAGIVISIIPIALVIISVMIAFIIPLLYI